MVNIVSLIILTSVALIVLLIFAFQESRRNISICYYIILSILIVFNTNLLFIDSIYVSNIFNLFFLKDNKTVSFNTDNPNIVKFYTEIKKLIKDEDSFYILPIGVEKSLLNESNLSLQTRLAKYKLVYYLLPSRLVSNINKADYLIIINLGHKPATIFLNGKVIQHEKNRSSFTLKDIRSIGKPES